MDLGGILAGAMAGGGKAIQLNAQNQLEQQRKEALAKLERDFKMDAITYEQDRSDQRAASEARAESQQAAADREAEMARLRAEGDQELRLLELEAELESRNRGRSQEGVLKARDDEISEVIRNERESRRAFPGMESDPVDTNAIAREVSERYARMYPEYKGALMQGFPSTPDNTGGGGSGLIDPNAFMSSPNSN